MIKQLFGPVALSPFRTQILLQRCQAICPKITNISVRFVHFIELRHELNNEEETTVERLLQYGPDWSVKSLTGASYFVVPRFGTISPWSSKATDIAQNCGLTAIKRIERGKYFEIEYSSSSFTDHQQQALQSLFYDPLTEVILFGDNPDFSPLFAHHEADPLQMINVLQEGRDALVAVNQKLGLALSADEMDYLLESYQQLQRNPTDVELMMFAQANSEHCRHKIFNANWIIDGETQSHSLFSMIKHTYQHHAQGVLSAYKDNAAVIAGHKAQKLLIDSKTHHYRNENIDSPFMIKVETHNHPTAISPFPGAATGSGGEIRDEGATGRGARPKAGLTGFSVSHLRIPGWQPDWIDDYPTPKRMQNALSIMIEGPIGGAAFNNEFGRPNLSGYFRSFEYAKTPHAKQRYGYHKPIMIAGGMGNIQARHVQKQQITEGALLIVMGGPAMLIGLGGGAASSMVAGQSQQQLDFASVQRDNAEIQRRCQELIDRCCALGDANPIISIHDVGAGGLSNALPELIHDSKCGGQFQLRDIPNAEPGMSPLAIWCNEAQERYVLAIAKQHLESFTEMAKRERCPVAVVGYATTEEQLTLNDQLFDNKPIDLPMSILFGKPPKLQCNVNRQKKQLSKLNWKDIDLTALCEKVLSHPTVASKSFLITIGDRSVGGMTARDQMVGPWQVPVADVAVTLTDYHSTVGEAMAMGERTPLALINPAASGRMAVAEAVLNIAATSIQQLSDIKLSANWMAAAQQPEQLVALYDTVKAVAMEMCPALNLTIPVGKDSLSMQTQWQQDKEDYSVTSPLSLIISAFSPVSDVRKTLTPQCRTDKGETLLLLIDLGRRKNRMGGSIAAEVQNQLGDEAPDVNDPKQVKTLFDLIQQLNNQNLLLAYHDRSDGGLLATLVEMAFASHCGLDMDLTALNADLIGSLLNEELGVVIQIAATDKHAVDTAIKAAGLFNDCYCVATLNAEDKIRIILNDKILLEKPRKDWQQLWSQCSYHIQRLRDNPHCAEQEFAALQSDNPGLSMHLTYALNDANAYINVGVKPQVAILREQGVNGHMEMAAAFTRAGFDCVDVHMNDLLSNSVDLQQFVGLAACGGFSYGDVLGAGEGWAKNILFHPGVREQFYNFFHNTEKFALGVCNGCQMLANCNDLIPGTKYWPRFVNNTSEQYEARFVMVKVNETPSILMKGMAGSYLPVVVAHGEGRAQWKNDQFAKLAEENHQVCLQFCANTRDVTEAFPANPNGSPHGMTSFCNSDGRITIMMPHPERIFRTWLMSWYPKNWDSEDSPWMQIFYNARSWVG